MNLFETLKEVKKIEPRKDFTENSRRVVLAHEPVNPFSPHRILTRAIAITSSVVLAGALIFIVAGGLSATKLAPRFSSINPTALHAEAQAIDAQINLLNVNYVENTVSTKSISIKKPILSSGAATVASSSMSTTTIPATSTSTLSVDAALQELSQ